MTSEGTARRSIRIPDEIWRPAVRKAQERGETVSDVLRRALIAYLGDNTDTDTKENKQ
ncbi:MAG: hypothetical protein ACRDQX_12985 [Pseudonocardiaceae bacterium]